MVVRSTEAPSRHPAAFGTIAGFLVKSGLAKMKALGDNCSLIFGALCFEILARVGEYQVVRTPNSRVP